MARARALARQPKLLLLDEPLAALDKKLREHTQFELMSIQERTGVTFIVVTHDQKEAMTLSDRVAVMDRGQVKQIGSPTEIYEFPTSLFVAGFIGSITAFDARITGLNDGMATVSVAAFGTDITARATPGLAPGQTVILAIRPEKLTISQTLPLAGNVIPGKVRDLAYFGKDSLYRVTLPSGDLVSVHDVNARRGDEATRPADWDAKVWLGLGLGLGFESGSAILLAE